MAQHLGQRAHACMLAQAFLQLSVFSLSSRMTFALTLLFTHTPHVHLQLCLCAKATACCRSWWPGEGHNLETSQPLQQHVLGCRHPQGSMHPQQASCASLAVGSSGSLRRPRASMKPRPEGSVKTLKGATTTGHIRRRPHLQCEALQVSTGLFPGWLPAAAAHS